VSITHGIHELVDPEPASDFVIGYIVLAVSFLLEGFSFLQSVRQARREARALRRDLIDHVLATSDPTLPRARRGPVVGEHCPRRPTTDYRAVDEC
jgi:hypothetical protein